MLSAGELAVLGLACRQADALTALDAQVTADGVMVAGAKGQPVIHPAVIQLRHGRLTLSRLIASLALPVSGETAGRTPRSRHAQRAASVGGHEVARIEEAHRGEQA